MGVKKGPARIDCANKRFGQWTVLDCLGPDKHRQIKWRCKCDCGTVSEVTGKSLKDGRSKSCRRCMNVRHGHAANSAHSLEYRVWHNMKKRCYTPSSTGYAYYGGRGIGVCTEWRNSFEAFLSFVGKRPSADHEIDRIDSNGDYEPGNVRWTTRLGNMRNRRISKRSRD